MWDKPGKEDRDTGPLCLTIFCVLVWLASLVFVYCAQQPTPKPTTTKEDPCPGMLAISAGGGFWRCVERPVRDSAP